MKIKVLTYEVKMNKKNEAYYLLKCEDKHSYNLPGKVGTPQINAEYEVEYDETEYEYQGKKVKSKWITKFKGNMVEQAQKVLGGELKPVSDTLTVHMDNKTWDDAVKLVGCFITGKKGDYSADEIGNMIKKCYNELLKTKGSL